MIDLTLFQTADGGEIEIENGTVTMSGGLSTSVYLSLFGGNEDDDGRKQNARSWWGNVGETPARQYRSETQHLLQSLTAIPANLLRIEDAVTRDLAWLLDERVASDVTASVTMPGLNTVRISVRVTAEGEERTFQYVENWKRNL